MNNFNLEDSLRNIGRFFGNIISICINSLEDNYVLRNAFGITSILLLVFIVLFIKKIRSNKLLKKNSKNMDDLIQSLNATKGLDKNLNDLLSIFYSIIIAYGYCFYLLDEKNQSYVLKSVRFLSEGSSNIAPSYSGLLPFEKETYNPPFSIPRESIPDVTCVVYDGKVPLVVIPVKGKKGIIRIGPKKNLDKNVRKQLDLLAEKFQPVLNMLIEMEKLRNRVEVVVASNDAMHNISKIIMNEQGIINTIIGICLKSISASGGFILKENAGGLQLVASQGWDKNTVKLFSNDKLLFSDFKRILENENAVILKKEDISFNNLPAYFSATGLQLIYLIKIDTGSGCYIGGFWFNNNSRINEIKEQKITELMTMIKRIRDILKNYISIKELSDNYLDMLKKLVQMLDNQSPFTVGYSDLMYRYVYIIAKEMGVEAIEIKEIATAAFLSNIGMLGLSKDMSGIEGRFTELEYEMIKLHSDVGASIIEATVSNEKIASYIRHHHERIDGFGYPSGLKGDEVPLGARIIAVVQTFLAKINGRSDRPPLKFEQALSVLKSASGTQLDSMIVDTFINWFRRKQASASTGKALGDCWEMRCSSESICISCSSYKISGKNCWDNKNVNCEAHGNKCDTCFIYTEYMNRMKL